MENEHPIRTLLRSMEKTQDWLREQMERRGVTVGKSVVSDILNDRRPCTWAQAKAMSQALGGLVGVAELMDRVRDKRTPKEAPDAPAPTTAEDAEKDAAA